MSLEANKYLESASAKIKAGNKKEANTDLDLAEMEIDMLSDEEASPLRKRLQELKEAMNNQAVNPEKREDVLNSLQRRAETIKMRFQSQDTAKHEIADFEEFFKREENFNNLHEEDREKIQKQIAGFKKISDKYAAEEIREDIQQILNDFNRYHEEMVQAVEQDDAYELDRLIERSISTGKRFEEETKSLTDSEVIAPLIEEFNATKQVISKLVKAFNDKQAEAKQANTETQEQAEQDNADRFYHVAQELPPQPIQEDGRLLGRIVFSPQPIIIGKEDINQLKNHFEAGEQVFGMAYLADTRKNVGFEKGVRLTIQDIEDGRGYSIGFDLVQPFRYEADNENQTATIYDLDIFANYEDAWDKELTTYLLQFLSIHLKNAPNSPYGDNSHKIHKLKVEIEAGYQPIARGIFTYDLREGHDKIHQLYATHTQASLKAFKLPESKRQDEELAEKLKQVMIGHGVDVQKVVFSTADWGIMRHELTGVVIRRTIWAYIVYKNEKGEYHYDDVQFGEDFIGNDFCGTIKKIGYGTAHGQILEENL